MKNKREPRYSGPNCSGVCVCGCSWEEHHLGIVMNQDYIEQTGEAYLVDECEAFGFNEVSGRKYNETTDEWDDHCHQYRDNKLNDKH